MLVRIADRYNIVAVRAFFGFGFKVEIWLGCLVQNIVVLGFVDILFRNVGAKTVRRVMSVGCASQLTGKKLRAVLTHHHHHRNPTLAQQNRSTGSKNGGRSAWDATIAESKKSQGAQG